MRKQLFFRSIAGLALMGAALRTAGSFGVQLPLSEDQIIVFKRNGGWCWYQDERVILSDGTLVIGSVAARARDGSSKGDVEVTSYDLESGESTTFKLAPEFQSDDHDVPAFLTLPDGRILASYMTHGGGRTEAATNLMRWRISTRGGDATDWGDERTLEVGAGISYTNLFMLSAEEDRIYNYHRGIGRNPNYTISDDGGATFSYGGRLLNWPRPDESDSKFTGIDGARPYLKYASNNVDTIHFVTTEDHPRAYDNSIYHAYIKGSQVYHSDGKLIGALGATTETDIKPTDLTPVFVGGAEAVAWTIDLHLDREGNPYTAFSVQKDGAPSRGKRGASEDGQDHRFFYGRWEKGQWNVNEMAYAGTRLYPKEDDYTGLVALHPMDPDTVFISTNADPVTGEPLISRTTSKRQREIYKGVTNDGGKSWKWTPVTEDSSLDNIRPIVPIWEEGRTALLWLRGTFNTYTDYDLDIVGMIE